MAESPPSPGDRDDFDVHGINAAIREPYGERRGNVTGLALGMPLTGASRVTGSASVRAATSPG